MKELYKVKWDFNKCQVSSWSSRPLLREVFGERNEGFAVSATNPISAIKFVAETYNLNGFYLKAERA